MYHTLALVSTVQTDSSLWPETLFKPLTSAHLHNCGQTCFGAAERYEADISAASAATVSQASGRSHLSFHHRSRRASIMGLFNRKNNGQDSNNSTIPRTSRRRKVAGGDQQVSVIHAVPPPRSLYLSRYGLQTAAVEGLAANSDPEDRFTYLLHHFGPLCTDRWAPHLGSSMVSEITIDYTGCENLQSSPPQSLSFTVVPSDKYSYHLRDADSSAASRVTPPQYARVADPNAPVGEQNQCILRFDIPADMSHTVLLYYKMTNFYQNHRRYVKSFDSDQLKGKAVSIKDLRTVIANHSTSTATGKLSILAGSSLTRCSMLRKHCLAREHKKYTNKPDYDPSAIVPPPNWHERFPGGYNETNIPRLADDQHFQNWMRTAGLPTFTKLYGRNDNDNLPRDATR
ncbi:Lem3/Cdc [Salix suchowensis]|nr:Lem3/Cdc [Salix suchowensis]